MKRDERGVHICVRLSSRHYMPHLGSISSLFLFRLLTINAPQSITLNERQEKVIEYLICQKDKAKECLGQ